MIRYLSVEQVILIHEYEIDKYGGSDGIIDISLLESAVYRPKSSLYGSDLYIDIYSKAASFFESIIKNHPFVDGNKRTAVHCVLVFLELNGLSLEVGQKTLEELPIKIINNELNTDELISILQNNSIKH